MSASPVVPANSYPQLGLDLQDELPLGLVEEDSDYLSRQLVTYIGNKRALLALIESALQTVRERTGRERLRILDAFSGSGVVSRMFKQYSSELVANDIEDYAREISCCYLANRGEAPLAAINNSVAAINREVAERTQPSGFIRELYAPRNEADIHHGERAFYTPDNAYKLDAYRQLVGRQDANLRPFLMGPLLSAASIHANTAGVFKGFYKDKRTGVGKFGGSGADALSRIKAPISLDAPILSRFECDYSVSQCDANDLISEVGGFDVAYFDPPYNQHPYGSNYFMLNLLVNYEAPTDVSRVSGIPTSWKRSAYNVRSKALPRLRELVEGVDASFIILSFNDDGFISPPELREALNSVGRVTEQTQLHATFRGCRNLRNRSAQVTEHVYLIEKW